MRVVFLLFDSLNLKALSPYGGLIPTPNFDRLAARTATFDSHYVGSMPCMPARRDLHSGRLNFLHRSWGPLEPFDDSFPEIMGRSNIYSHLVSDHYHYFEDGGATYHTRYTTWDFIRGQEADPWVALVEPPLERLGKKYHEMQFETDRAGYRFQGMLNREKITDKHEFPSVKCFDAALNFLDVNGKTDNWFMQLETFDPHEPFTAPQEFRDEFPSGYEGPILDWPLYRQTGSETDLEMAELQVNYSALIALCDDQLGRLLDDFDANDRWADTALVVTTDHGFLLGEHDWWAKNRMPFYNEIANIPLFIHHPEAPKAAGTRIKALTQTMDLMPTFLDFFSLQAPEDVQGKSLLPLLENPQGKVRDIAIYGIFGGSINATDGRYTYFHYPDQMESRGLFEYTLMPTHARSFFEPRELELAGIHHGFDFTKGVPVLKIPALPDAKRSPMQGGFSETRSVLYDLEKDPQQETPISNPDVVARLKSGIAYEFRHHNAPDELYRRFALKALSE